MFRNLMLWWLTTGFYCVENENGQHASGHTTLGHNVELAFALAVFYFVLTIVSHDGTASAVGEGKRAEKSIVYFTSTVLAQQGVIICDKGGISIVKCRKGKSCLLCIFAFLICDYNISTDSVHLVCPLSDVVLRCFETTVSLLFLLSVTALWPEPCGSLWS